MKLKGLPFLCCFLLLGSLPRVAAALTVTIVTSVTVGGATSSETRQFLSSASNVVTSTACLDAFGNTVATCPSGTTLVSVTTTTLPITNSTGGLPITFTTNGFTIDCSTCTGAAPTPNVITQQSGSVQRLFVSNMKITAPSSGSCSVTTPCTVKITASSDSSDNFVPLSAGPTPSGVLVGGSFNGADTTGDTIAVAGRGNSGDVINFIGGGGSSDTPVSLPSSCSASAACAFVASFPPPFTFQDSISETSQLNCGTSTSCPPSVGATATITFANLGDIADLPQSIGVVQSLGSVAPLVTLMPPFKQFTVSLDIGGFPSFQPATFQWVSQFTLNDANITGINPATDTVYLRIGPSFRLVFPAGSFAPNAKGYYTFSGLLQNVNLQAIFKPLDAASPHKQWEFDVQGQNANMSGTTNPVSVELTIRHDIGRTLVQSLFQ